MVKRCIACGKELDERQMEKVFTGRVKYLCPECYKNGIDKVRLYEFAQMKRKERQNGR